MTIPAIVTESTVSIMLEGKMHVLDATHPNYNSIRNALKDGADEVELLSLVDVAAAIEDFGEGCVTVEHGVVMYNGQELHNTLTDRIISMMREGFNIKPMLLFLENLMENPDYRAVNELYGFLEATDLPITANGHFRAYKMVRQDYTSHHASPDGTHMDNSVGSNPTMPRNQVNPDKNKTCSDGLHFCSQGYLGFYASGGRTMILEINPRDVVSIPADYNNAKGRACSYKVVGEIEMPNMDSKLIRNHTFGASLVDSHDYGDHKSGDWVFKIEAANILCGDTMDPYNALRKRISRGTVNTRVNIEGKTEVQLP